MQITQKESFLSKIKNTKNAFFSFFVDNSIFLRSNRHTDYSDFPNPFQLSSNYKNQPNSEINLEVKILKI